jgi:hypothetical protein
MQSSRSAHPVSPTVGYFRSSAVDLRDDMGEDVSAAPQQRHRARRYPIGGLRRFRDADHAASDLGPAPSTKQSAALTTHGPARWACSSAG